MHSFTSYPDLASRDLAGSVISANDELFAPRQNLIMPTQAVHAVDSFGHTGKVYDGWETRRRRRAGLRLGDRPPGRSRCHPRRGGRHRLLQGQLSAAHLDRGDLGRGLSHGRHPSRTSTWETLVPKTDARGDTENYYPVEHPGRWTHVRLTIYPDGGVARLRVHGEVVLDPRYLMASTDLVALENGGRLLGTSDAFYSSPVNLILPSRARLMGEGWENARRRGPGHDWAVFQLGVPGSPTQVEVDTSYFIGNAPDSVRVSAADADAGPIDGPLDEGDAWWDLVPQTPVLVDTRHRFLVADDRRATHLRLDVYPDGGLTRLRCFGEISEAARAEMWERFQAKLPDYHRRQLIDES